MKEVKFTIPENIIFKILQTFVYHCADLAQRTMGEESFLSIKQLEDDKDFRNIFSDAIHRAINKFNQLYAFEDEDVFRDLSRDLTFWDCNSIDNAIQILVKRPSDFLNYENNNGLEFNDVLPNRVNRDRVDKFITTLFEHIANEIWSLGAFKPIYQLKIRKENSTSTDLEKKLLENPIITILQIKNNVPNPDFINFIGREKEFHDIIALLRPYPYSQYHVISIDGIGGVGKTALAMAIAYHFIRNAPIIDPIDRFDAVVWTSAKKNVLSLSGITNRDQALRNLGDIYTSISQTLERTDVLSAIPDKQDSLVKYILSKSRVLLIVDNLETIDDSRVMSFLKELPAPTKVILTTRHRSIDGAYPIRLKGMEKGDILILINEECKKKRIDMSKEDKNELSKRTAGVPLAVVWTIGQVSKGHPIENALLRLHSASKDYARFVFSETMNLLKKRGNWIGIKLLMGLSLFVDGANREAVGFICGIDGSRDERDDNLSELIDLSLINFENGRFSMLPLTRDYALAELAQDLEFQVEATNRWFEWHASLAEQGGGGKLDLDASILETLKIEHTNILWAINSSFTHERFDVFVRLLRGMGFYWMGTGFWNDYENYYNKGRMLAPDPHDRIHFSIRLVWLNILRQDFVKAEEMLRFSKELLEDYPNNYELMRWEDYCGQLNMEMERYEIAEKHLMNSLNLSCQISDRRGQFACLKYLGELNCRIDNSTQAKFYLLEAEPYAAGTGEDQWIRGLAHLAQLRGMIDLVDKKWEDAILGFQSCIDYLGIWPDERLLTRAYLGLAFSNFKIGKLDETKEYLETNRLSYLKLGMTTKAIPIREILLLWGNEDIKGFWNCM